MFTPGCECALSSGYVFTTGCSGGADACKSCSCASSDTTCNSCGSASSYDDKCKSDHGSHAHAAQHTTRGDAVTITCACDDGYTGLSAGNCRPTPANSLADAIQSNAPTQSCTIELWHDAFGAIAGALSGTGGGQTDCSGEPDQSGDCVETIEGLIAAAGPEAELAQAIISKLTGTNAQEICSSICEQACFGVLGWAMSPYSPCLVDAAPVATFRIVCLPPWGLVAVVCILAVLKVCCSACCEKEETSQRSQPLIVTVTRK